MLLNLLEVSLVLQSLFFFNLVTFIYNFEIVKQYQVFLIGGQL